MIHRRHRKHRQLPLPRSFKLERREHWLDRREREIEDHEETLRRRALEPSEGRAENFDADLDRS